MQGYGIASYAHSLLKQFKGEWEYDTNWKMINGYPKKAGWIKAIQEGQRQVKKGLKTGIADPGDVVRQILSGN